MSNVILITGGMGYIGSHTITSLIENGYDIVSIDNFSNSHPFIKKQIENIVQQKITNINLDITNYSELIYSIKKLNINIDGVIHFAAYKSVEESVINPLKYYENNIINTINILKMCKEFKIKSFIFSSSCTVYGTQQDYKVSEKSPLQAPLSPYGATKQMCESLIQDFAKSSDCSCISLRYFNPAGSHPSYLIGELPLDKPKNLVPLITQTGIGKHKQLEIYGDDYDTPDGTCIRDFIHVMDLAEAHVKALEFANSKALEQYEIFNIGTGNGTTILSLIDLFIEHCSKTLNYSIAKRRLGDIEKIYASNTKAIEQLSWKPKYNNVDILKSAWEWEKNLASNEFK